MYWCGPRDHAVGGKMLKLIFTTLLFTLSFSALACWKVEGSVAVDGETYKLHQKVDHNKEYMVPMGNFIFKFTIKPGKKKIHDIKYVLQEKKGIKLTLVTQGEDEVIEGGSKEIFAKGEEGQPHSLITLKLRHI